MKILFYFIILVRRSRIKNRLSFSVTKKISLKTLLWIEESNWTRTSHNIVTNYRKTFICFISVLNSFYISMNSPVFKFVIIREILFPIKFTFHLSKGIIFSISLNATFIDIFLPFIYKTNIKYRYWNAFKYTFKFQFNYHVPIKCFYS